MLALRVGAASSRRQRQKVSMVEVLLRRRVRSILAMAYKVTEEAVESSMGIFYQSLLAGRASIRHAARIARSALLGNPLGRARHMYSLRLAGYLVPVLYNSEPSGGVPSEEPQKVVLNAVGRMMESVRQVLLVGMAAPGLDPVARDADLPEDLLGRDFNPFSLEMVISISPLVLLHGQGGVGKTELLRYACD